MLASIGFWLPQPSLDNRLQRLRLQVVELVPPLSNADQEPGGFQNVQVLRDALPRCADLVLRRESRAQLEERLAISFR
jgi:hypothetical protein